MKRPTVHQRYPNQPAPAATIASTTAIIASLRRRAGGVCGLSDGLSAGGGLSAAMGGAAARPPHRGCRVRVPDLASAGEFLDRWALVPRRRSPPSQRDWPVSASGRLFHGP